MSSQICFIITTTVIYVVMALCVEISWAQDEKVEWVRLCTLTSNSSSMVNVTMPCGIHVEIETETNSAKDGVSTDRGYDVNDQLGDDLGNERENVNGKNDSDFRFEKISQSSDFSEETVQSDYDADGQDYATVEEATVEGDDFKQNDHEYRQQSTVKRVMLAYLLDAKHQLYNKINYLLNVLKNTFFTSRLNRRQRRNTIERQITLNAKRKSEDDKKNQSIVSMIMEPSFERSLMTMSILTFGVFIIQVVQKLMHTMQHSSELKSMVSSLTDNLPTTRISPPEYF